VVVEDALGRQSNRLGPATSNAFPHRHHMQASHFLTRTLTSKDSLQNGVAWMLKIDNHQIATAYTLPNSSKYEKTKLKHVKSYPTKNVM
jgi:hypothetical protein